MHWKQLPQAGAEQPGPRSSHALAACGGKLFLFGGEREPRVPLPAQTFAYDMDSGTWSVLETTGCCPGPRIAATMAAVGDQLFLYGGRTGVDMAEGAKSDLYAFDTASNEWQPVALADKSPSPPARSYHSMAASSDKLFVFGGCGSGGRLNDLWCYNIAPRTWSQLDSGTVAARGGSVLVVSADGQQLYLLGGFNGDELQDCHMFDVARGSWSCPSCCSGSGGSGAGGGEQASAVGQMTMLMGRSVFGAVLHSSSKGSGADSSTNSCSAHSGGCEHASHVVTFGGEVAPSDKGHAGAGDFTDVLMCLDPGAAAATDTGSRRWHTLQVAEGGCTGPGPRGWFAATATPDGSMVVHGGLDAENERRGDMFILCMH